jgi:peptidoglycan hydrolase-like protein with peptidoglycan-binding domain
MNDTKLEAAAVSDQAHITKGARGDHVRKIQLALIRLNGAAIDDDGVYGPGTAAAVLAFKTRRNIVNRAYQRTADDIVGKMTIAALDAEMLVAERDDARPLRIQAVHPVTYETRFTPDYATYLGSRTPSASGAKTLVEPPNIIVPPSGLFRTMELREGGMGFFQVVDGIGGTVRCWDERIGRVFSADEPLAHGGTMRVSQSPQRFAVRAGAPGRSTIQASKPSQTTWFGDMVSLVVVTGQWKAQWTIEKKFRMNANPWASHAFGTPPVPGMIIQSQLVAFKGSVDPDSSIPRDDFELGILQTVLQSRMVAVYVNSAGTPTWNCTISCPPSRDAADASPLWYHASAVKSLNAADGTEVESNDRPQNVVPWQTKDKKGTLVSSSGLDAYCTWLAARQKSTGAFVFLGWVKWSVNWGCTFDFKTEGRNLTGTTEITGQGEGIGLNTPITSGPRAIEQTTMKWIGPAGGY